MRLLFYEVADRLGIEKLGEWGKRFGLEGNTGLEIEEVASSIGGPERKAYDNRFNIIYGIRKYMTEAGCFKDVDPGHPERAYSEACRSAL